MCPNVISEKSYHNALCIELTASKLEARLCSDDVKRTTRTEELQFRFFLQTGVSTAYERETQKKNSSSPDAFENYFSSALSDEPC